MASNKLTKEQRSERMKEAWARRRTAQGHVEGAKERTDLHVDPATTDAEVITIHFVSDGFTAFSQVWYQGQEISIEVGSPQHQETFDTKGKTWLDYDAATQTDRYGRQMFADGPWPGRSIEDAIKEFENLSNIADPDERKRIEKRIQREAMPVGAGTVLSTNAKLSAKAS